MSTQYVTDAEVSAFADKLEAFGEQLSAKERALLGQILVRAAESPEEDVDGHSPLVDPTQAVIHLYLLKPFAYLAHSHVTSLADLHHHSHGILRHVLGWGRPPPSPVHPPRT